LYYKNDVVIVSAGIIESALAVILADQGRNVIFLEKLLKESDRIVGELLQFGDVQVFEKLGLRDCLEGIGAIKCRGYEVI
jgi:squalene monooxygenase